MLSSVKTWVTDKCWNMFSMDTWKQKSQIIVIVLTITFLLTIICLIAVAFTYSDFHGWKNNSDFIVVPKNKFVEIDGDLFIPIKIIN